MEEVDVKVPSMNHTSGQAATAEDVENIVKQHMEELESKITMMITDLSNRFQIQAKSNSTAKSEEDAVDSKLSRAKGGTLEQNQKESYFVDFLVRKQARQETLQSYMQSKWQLYQRCNPNWKNAYFPHVKNEIIKGMKNSAVRDSAQRSKANTFSQLYENIEDVTEINATTCARKKVPFVNTIFMDRSSSCPDDDDDDDDRYPPEELPSAIVLADDNDDDEYLQDEHQTTSTQLACEDDPEAFIRFKIADKAAIGLTLFSTGSETDSSMSEDFAKAIDLPLDPASVGFKDIGNNKIKPVGESMTEIQIFLENIQQPFTIKPIVVRGLNFPLIIGAGAIMNNLPMALSFSTRPATLECKGQTTQLRSIHDDLLKASADTRLLKVQKLCIKAGIKPKDLWCVYTKKDCSVAADNAN